MVLCDISSLSSWLVDFPNKVAFCSLTPCLSTYWPVVRASSTNVGLPATRAATPVVSEATKCRGGPAGGALTQYALIVSGLDKSVFQVFL